MDFEFYRFLDFKAELVENHKTPYVKSEATRLKISNSLKGNTPANKGKQTSSVLKKVELFKSKQPIYCKFHGEHTQWRIHTRNNVQCKLCSSERQKRSRDNNFIKYLLKDAKNRKIGFDLDESFIVEILHLQNNRCALSGIEFSDILKPSLDRINSDEGYYRHNVQLVLFEINRMKSNIKEERFIQLCKSVALRKAGKAKKGKSNGKQK